MAAGMFDLRQKRPRVSGAQAPANTISNAKTR